MYWVILFVCGDEKIGLGQSIDRANITGNASDSGKKGWADNSTKRTEKGIVRLFTKEEYLKKILL